MSLSALKFAARMAAKLEEQTTIVNETTTRVDENVPAVGAPVEPEPQVEEPLPTSDEPAEVEAPVVDTPVETPVEAPVEAPVEEPAVEPEVEEAPVADEPIVVEGEGDEEVVAEDQDGDGDVDTVEVELPEGVTAEDVEEVQTEIEEVVSEVEEEGVTPTTMKHLHRHWNDTLKLFGLNELPAIDSLKKDSVNLRAAVKTVNTLNALKKRLSIFK